MRDVSPVKPSSFPKRPRAPSKHLQRERYKKPSKPPHSGFTPPSQRMESSVTVGKETPPVHLKGYHPKASNNLQPRRPPLPPLSISQLQGARAPLGNSKATYPPPLVLAKKKTKSNPMPRIPPPPRSSVEDVMMRRHGDKHPLLREARKAKIEGSHAKDLFAPRASLSS